MNKKLTFTMKESIIKKEKKYANEKWTSLCDLVENYLKGLTTEVSQTQIQLSPKLNSLKASFNAPKNMNDKKE